VTEPLGQIIIYIHNPHTIENMAGENPLVFVELIVVKGEMINALRNSDIVFMKYGGPLHRRSMQFLTGQTMAYFCIYRIRAYFVLYRIAVTTCPVFGFKIDI
jgi:hypothetical protein